MYVPKVKGEPTLRMKGSLVGKLIPTPGPGLLWKLSNLPKMFRGLWRTRFMEMASGLTGFPVLAGDVAARLIRADGNVINYGTIGYMVITDAGVGALVDDWADGSKEITDFKFHASGTGVGAEAVGDTALGTESTTITDRATGVQSQPSANQLRSVATQTYTGAGAITEHGLFNIITESTGIIWDRSVFSAINVANGDSIQWTYTCTVSSGG